jgi:fibronectin type 3 domain-containing protein
VVTGKVNSRKCKLTWTAVTGAVTYNVYRDGIPIKTLIKATSYTDAAVTHGTTYSYYVYAVDVDGQGNPSNEVDLTP